MKEIILNRTQAQICQQIGVWGIGKCTWHPKSWDGKEFTEAIAFLSEQDIKEFNVYAETHHLDGSDSIYDDYRLNVF